VGRDLDRLGFSHGRAFNTTDREVLSEIRFHVLVSEFIDTCDSELSTKSIDGAVGLDFVAGKVVISDVSLSGLVYIERLGQLLSLEQKGERVSTIISVMALSDFSGIVSQEIVNDKLKVITSSEESENSSVIVQELFLGSNSTTAEGLLHELFQIICLLGGSGLVSILVESVLRDFTRLGLGLANVIEKLLGVIINTCNSNALSVNSNIQADSEVGGE